MALPGTVMLAPAATQQPNVSQSCPARLSEAGAALPNLEQNSNCDLASDPLRQPTTSASDQMPPEQTHTAAVVDQRSAPGKTAANSQPAERSPDSDLPQNGAATPAMHPSAIPWTSNPLAAACNPANATPSLTRLMASTSIADFSPPGFATPHARHTPAMSRMSQREATADALDMALGSNGTLVTVKRGSTTEQAAATQKASKPSLESVLPSLQPVKSALQPDTASTTADAAAQRAAPAEQQQLKAVAKQQDARQQDQTVRKLDIAGEGRPTPVPSSKQTEPAQPSMVLSTDTGAAAALGGVTSTDAQQLQPKAPPVAVNTSDVLGTKAALQPSAGTGTNAAAPGPASNVPAAVARLKADSAKVPTKTATVAAASAARAPMPRTKQQPAAPNANEGATASGPASQAKQAAAVSTSGSQSGTTDSEFGQPGSDRIPALLQKYGKRKWDDQGSSAAATAACNGNAPEPRTSATQSAAGLQTHVPKKQASIGNQTSALLASDVADLPPPPIALPLPPKKGTGQADAALTSKRQKLDPKTGAQVQVSNLNVGQL